MFGRMMNNYYYGKSGKGDFRKEDLPETRMQLFRDTLRTRLGALCRLNLLYAIVWIPAMVLILLTVYNNAENAALEDIFLNRTFDQYQEMVGDQGAALSEEEFLARKESYESINAFLNMDYKTYIEKLNEGGITESLSEAEFYQEKEKWIVKEYTVPTLLKLALLALFITITGPFTAGVSYVTRNWARDEHAFIWSDFKDAVKSNWKIPLALSFITGIIPLVVYSGYEFYGSKAQESVIWMLPIIIVGIIGLVWTISITYMHPMTVTYDLKLKDIIKNGFLLGIARLPFSVGIRLLHCVPVLICLLICQLFGMNIVLACMILGAYYILIGFTLSRFITASYTNAVFDRFINRNIDGAKVNQGMKESEEDDDYNEEEEPETDRDPGKE